MKRAIIFSMILTIVVIILGASCTQTYNNNSSMNSNSMNGNMMNSNSMNGNMMNQNNMMNNSNASRMMGLQSSPGTAK